jgi:tRNA A-37 threonylcarbamoyl transferase component Bud32
MNHPTAKQPRSFGRYQLAGRLGRGGMAEVWKAYDDTGRTVVIKRLLPSLSDNEEVLDMFRHEGRLATRFRHPGLVAGYEMSATNGEPYLAMEYVAGRDLGQVLGSMFAMGRPQVGFGVYVARELCRALAYVHALTDGEGAPLGLIHRDISPANVMVGEDGSIKLLDFGIAKSHDEDREKTEAGVLKGKIAYLSPEAVEERELDHRSDQFAVGVVLHEMLSGRRLFRGANDLETLRNVLNADVEAPSVCNPAVPPELDRICLRALSKNRKDRFASCRDMAVELDAVVERMGWTHLEVSRLMRQLFDGAPEPLLADETTPSPRYDAPLDLGEPTRSTRSTPIKMWMIRSRGLARQAVVLLALFVSLGGVTGWRMASGRPPVKAKAALAAFSRALAVDATAAVVRVPPPRAAAATAPAQPAEPARPRMTFPVRRLAGRTTRPSSPPATSGSLLIQEQY